VGRQRDKKRKAMKKGQGPALPPLVESELLQVAHVSSSHKEFDLLVTKNRDQIVDFADRRGVSLSIATQIFLQQSGRISRRLRNQLFQRAHSPDYEGSKAREHWAKHITVESRIYGRKGVGGVEIIPLSVGFNEMGQAIGKAMWKNDYELAEGIARLAGADPDKVTMIAGADINIGSNARVFKFGLATPQGEKSFILNACNHWEGSEHHKLLQAQYRNTLFFKFDMAGVSSDNSSILVAQRMALAPRRGCPEELVTPYLEGYGREGDDYVYMFTAEVGFPQRADCGVELNRFEAGSNYKTNPVKVATVDEEQSTHLSKEIIRVCTQLHACTYDPRTGLGATPTMLSLNNGDIFYDPDTLKIRMGVVRVYHPEPGDDPRTSSAVLVDMLVSPRYYIKATGEPQAWIMEPKPENLPLIMDAMAAGFEAVFPGDGRELAVKHLKHYAEIQGSSFDEFMRAYLERAGDIRDSESAVKVWDGIRDSNRSVAYLCKNTGLVQELGYKILKEVGTPGFSLPHFLEGAKGRLRPQVVPQDFIEAIGRL
jgi:hypothetical protein